MSSSVVLADGGINSTVVALRARAGGDVHLLFVDYGQPPAARQLFAVRAIGERIGAASTTAIELPHVARLAAVRRPGPGRAPADRGPLAGLHGLTPARVPGLMPAMLSAALQMAHRLEADAIHLGASELVDAAEAEAGFAVRPADHRREFFYLFNLALEALQLSRHKVTLEIPLIDLSAEEIVKLALHYEAPLHLVWHCQTSGESACGRCPGCVSSTRALAAAGVAGPLETASR